MVCLFSSDFENSGLHGIYVHFLEAIINIVSGQFVLLVLKLGYFTNTTYGYIKWSKYIQSHTKNRGKTATNILSWLEDLF